MNNEKTKEKVSKVVEELITSKGYAAPVDVLLNMEVLSQMDYAEWRRGRVQYLEKVCSVNLNKMSLIMRELKGIARKKHLKPSRTAYKKWGKGAKGDLRFSKTGAKHIEEAYATHYVAKKLQKESKKNGVKQDKK